MAGIIGVVSGSDAVPQAQEPQPGAKFLRGQNIVGVQYYIDSNVVIDSLYRAREYPESVELLRFWREGWIGLARTDVMDTERTDGQDEQTVATRLAETADIPEAFGAAVWGHFRWDAAVYGTGEDEERLHAVFTVLFPDTAWDRATKNEKRDAMHIATSIRYGGYAFVTRDALLVAKDDAIQALPGSGGMRVWTPAQALTETASRVAATRRLHSLQPSRGPLPAWPPTPDVEADATWAAVVSAGPGRGEL